MTPRPFDDVFTWRWNFDSLNMDSCDFCLWQFLLFMTQPIDSRRYNHCCIVFITIKHFLYYLIVALHTNYKSFIAFSFLPSFIHEQYIWKSILSSCPQTNKYHTISKKLCTNKKNSLVSPLLTVPAIAYLFGTFWSQTLTAT